MAAFSASAADCFAAARSASAFFFCLFAGSQRELGRSHGGLRLLVGGGGEVELVLGLRPGQLDFLELGVGVSRGLCGGGELVLRGLLFFLRQLVGGGAGVGRSFLAHGCGRLELFQFGLGGVRICFGLR